MLRTICACDIDNTILTNHDAWDKLCRNVSWSLTGTIFSLSRLPNGAPDHHWLAKNLDDIIKERLWQIRHSGSPITAKMFYEELECALENAVDEMPPAKKFEGVELLLSEICRFCSAKPVIITSGPRFLQLHALQQTRLISYFHPRYAFFHNQFKDKTEALRKLAALTRPDVLIHIGDLPSDMAAVLEPTLPVPRCLAVGVAVEKHMGAAALRRAGAQFVFEKFTASTIEDFKVLVR